MRIDNVEIYGMAESIAASGLPMVADYDADKFAESVKSGDGMKRAVKLASAPGGESHDCFLCGITVQMNVTAPRYWWPEFQRYHFADIISSTSTMHRLKAVLDDVTQFNDMDEASEEIKRHFSEWTTYSTIEQFLKVFRVKHIYCATEAEEIEYLKANLPDGFLQTARVTTNYRQLKTIYHQRRSHRLKEWHDFCEWVKTLPDASQFITLDKE